MVYHDFFPIQLAIIGASPLWLAYFPINHYSAAIVFVGAKCNVMLLHISIRTYFIGKLTCFIDALADQPLVIQIWDHLGFSLGFWANMAQFFGVFRLQLVNVPTSAASTARKSMERLDRATPFSPRNGVTAASEWLLCLTSKQTKYIKWIQTFIPSSQCQMPYVIKHLVKCIEYIQFLSQQR